MPHVQICVREREGGRLAAARLRRRRRRRQPAERIEVDAVAVDEQRRHEGLQAVPAVAVQPREKVLAWRARERPEPEHERTTCLEAALSLDRGAREGAGPQDRGGAFHRAAALRDPRHVQREEHRAHHRVAHPRCRTRAGVSEARA